MKEISLQLFSIRDAVAEDFKKALEEVAKMGYTGVEFAGCRDITKEDMKKILTDNGLKPVGAHIGHEILETKLDEQIEYHSYLGTKYMVCPWGIINTVEEAKKSAEIYNPIAEKITKAGMVFAYHNHKHEFVLDNEQYPMEVFYAETDPQYVKAEIDVYWIKASGLDPIEYIKKYKDRLPLIHLKQMLDEETKAGSNAENGIIDFKKVIEVSKTLGTKEYIYEQEGKEDAIGQAALSAKYLLSL